MPNLKDIKKKLKAGQKSEALSDIRQLVSCQETPATSFIHLKKLIDAHYRQQEKPDLAYHVISNHILDYLGPILEVMLWAQGKNVQVTCSSYGNIDSELMLAQQVDDRQVFVVLLNGQLFIDRSRPPSSEGMLDELMGALSNFAKTHEGKVIWTLPDLPHEHLISTGQKKIYASWRKDLQSFISDKQSIIDLQDIQLQLGSRVWWNPALFYTSGVPFSFEGQVQFCREVAKREQYRTYPLKALVLDLDNTLWGGVLGDLGIDGIQIGSDDSVAHAYWEFQRFLITLKEQGIILCVCSKNDDDNVRNVLKNHPHMVLREDDFACIRANWNPKSENISEIANQLNLPLEAFAFVDDSPVEIEEVSSRLSQVTTVLLPEDPSEYIATVSTQLYFGESDVSHEDANRTQYYKDEERRQKLAQSHRSYDDFLKSLKMKMTEVPFNAQSISRIEQMFKKTNQFNLTTRRHSESDLMKFAQLPKTWCRGASLEDKLGPYGIITALIATPKDDTILSIESWLMSCRVFKRHIEYALFDNLVNWAQKEGFTTLECEYFPTAKNKNMPELLDALGMSCTDQDEARSIYAKDISSHNSFKHHIDVQSI